MIKVCDAIMGTGKSSAAINHMNEHPDSKFIYITPYLEEAKRIKDSCPKLRFIEPSNKLSEFNFKKSTHAAELIKDGRNIATTHQAFKEYTTEMLDNIRDKHYTLIIDENVDIMESFNIHPDDLDLVVSKGYVSVDNGIYTLNKNNYKGNSMRELFRFLKTRQLIAVEDTESSTLFYWAIPPEFLTSFGEVFILTYLFEGQSLCRFLKIYNLEYIKIGVSYDDGVYRFSEDKHYIPEYVSGIADKIHILQRQKINNIGDSKHALSMNWFKREYDKIEEVKKNLNNCFNNIWRGAPPKERLWGTYCSDFNKIKGKGYIKSFLPFNARATNQYRDRRYLAYIANPFMNVGEKLFYKNHGVEVDEDQYALSIMVQWIWRSAIRDGQEIYLYIPSKRMRTLLTDWIDSLVKGGVSA